MSFKNKICKKNLLKVAYYIVMKGEFLGQNNVLLHKGRTIKLYALFVFTLKYLTKIYCF